MKCPECENEMRVAGYKNVICGADSPNTPTELKCVQTLVCVNPNCSRRGDKHTLSHALNFEEE